MRYTLYVIRNSILFRVVSISVLKRFEIESVLAFSSIYDLNKMFLPKNCEIIFKNLFFQLQNKHYSHNAHQNT